MNEFVTWLNSVETLSLHPVRFAALAHYRLVHIHPFSDGNGRTSRLLMNLILMQAGTTLSLRIIIPLFNYKIINFRISPCYYSKARPGQVLW